MGIVFHRPKMGSKTCLLGLALKCGNLENVPKAYWKGLKRAEGESSRFGMRVGSTSSGKRGRNNYEPKNMVNGTFEVLLV